MQNWNKVVKLKDSDVVIQKHYDEDDENKAHYKVDVIINVRGALNKFSMAFRTEEEQNKTFESFEKDQVQGVYDYVMEFHEE